MLRDKGFHVRSNDTDKITLTRNNRNTECIVDIGLPPVGSDYIVEVTVYEGKCVETALEAAKTIEEKLNILFNPRDTFSKIKDLGIGASLTSLSFYFNLSRQTTGREPAQGTKSAPLEITIRLGLYTVVKFKARQA